MYIIVNDRVPRQEATCPFCCLPVCEHYVRELTDRILYCSCHCMQGHLAETRALIEHGRAI